MSITLDISSGNCDLDGFLYEYFHNNIQLTEIIDGTKVFGNLQKMYTYIHENNTSRTQNMIKWIPYSRIRNVNEIARGGFGTIYCASWHGIRPDVVLKRFENSQNFSRYFLSEVIFTIFNALLSNIY